MVVDCGFEGTFVTSAVRITATVEETAITARSTTPSADAGSSAQGLQPDASPRTVGELGEFALIAMVNAGRVQAPSVLLGPGDDAAVIAASEGRYVVTTDMLVQDRHFRLDWSSPFDIGRKAIAQNAADVVAMGAVPSAFVVALGCPSDTPVDFVRALTDGMWAEAGRAGGSIAGGDMVRSPVVTISVTALGDPRRAMLRRSGARPGDVIAVAGRLGWSGAGLAVLSAGLAPTGGEALTVSENVVAESDSRSDSGMYAKVVAAHRVPCPPYESVLELPDDAEVTALTDVSDGLLADLGHIAESSGVAMDLDSSALRDPALEPVAAALGADALEWVLTGGEDHAFAGAFADSGALPDGWRLVGRVSAGSGVTVDGVPRPGPAGWESFA